MGSVVKIQTVDFVGFGDFVELGPNYLTIADDATDEVFAGIATKLRTLDGALTWYIGDYFLALGTRRSGDRVMAQLEEWGVGRRSAYQSMLICEEFPRAERLEGLSFAHYRVAEAELEEHADMIEWLARALAEGMSNTELRKAIRRARRDSAAGGVNESPVMLDWHAVQGSIKFAAINPPSGLSPEDRETLAESAPRMVAWWAELADA